MYKGHMSKSERMQLKAWICVLGLLLLLIILIGGVIKLLESNEEPKVEVPHVPVIEAFSNVWIMEADSENLLVFRDGVEYTYPYAKMSDTTDGTVENGAVQALENALNIVPEQVREQIADIVVTDGVVTELYIKKEKLSGKILSADSENIEIEGYGKIPLADNYKGYRIYKSLAMCSVADLPFGYGGVDFVIENGQICGILMVKEEAMEYIRVLIKASDFAGNLHEQLQITADTSFTVQYGSYENRQSESHSAGEIITIDRNSPYFQGERLQIIPDVLTGKVSLQNVNRSQGIPSYRGHMELQLTEEGIIVINEVLLEEYLYCVVPSEMPASYPDEALQAQAVCARTYAYGHMQHAGYPQYGAHVDDSTSYQVYNNILEQESTTTAVKETYGQLLYTAGGELAGTYYYSTSCGVGTDATIWKTEEAKTLDYLKGKALNRQTMEQDIRNMQDASEGAVSGDVAGNTNASVELDMGELLKDETAFRNFISTVNPDDFEVTEGWYRWIYNVESIDTERMLGILQKRYTANRKLILTLEDGEYVSEPIEELEEIRNMTIVTRGRGGIADELVIETGEHTYKIISEHNIRYVLNNGESKVIRQDGSEVAATTLLPSAFITLNLAKKGDVVTGYTLAGGGFGHGVGMSQNGAKNMAKEGYTSDEILTFFYDGCVVRNVYEHK